MRLFVCMFALFAVTNAGFLNLGSLLGGGGGRAANAYKLKIVSEGSGHHAHHEGHGGSYHVVPTPASQVIKVVHQESLAGQVSEAGPQVIKVIHQESSASALATVPHLLNVVDQHPSAPVSQAQVINVVHQQTSGFNYDASAPAATAQVIKVIHQQQPGASGAVQHHASAPAKIIRVIHEHVQSQALTSNLAPVQEPAPVLSAPPLVQQYSVPAPTQQYLPPVQQYSAPVSVQQHAIAPAKVIHIIHEQVQSQARPQSFTSQGEAQSYAPPVSVAATSYLAPVQETAPVFNPPVPVQQYSAPAPTQQYLPPVQQYNVPTPTQQFLPPVQQYSAPDPIQQYNAPAPTRQYLPPVQQHNAPEHIPAQTYGPPSH